MAATEAANHQLVVANEWENAGKMTLPNFILITTDQQRTDSLGCYGNKTIQTPNIDALASRGVTFDRFYVSTPVCMPNRATLMTGRVPSVHGVRMNGIPLPLTSRTFVELLRGRGYRTALIGKCHLQNMEDIDASLKRQTPPPSLMPIPGADEASKENLHSSAYQQERRSSWCAPDHRLSLPYYGFEHVELCDNHGDEAFGDYERWLKAKEPAADRLRGSVNAFPDDRYVCPQAWRTRLPEELYPTSYIAEQTTRYLATRTSTSEAAPFFLHCSFGDPHHPFTPPGRYWDMYDPDAMTLPPSFGPAPPYAPPHLKWIHEERANRRTNLNSKRAIAVTAREAREAIALTFGMVTMIDDAVGRIMRALDDNGLLENTIVIFTSDHGDLMGEHGLLFKAPLHYQGLIRVPFIWRGPDRNSSARIGELYGTLDIAQTILTRAGVFGYNGMQGRNLLDDAQAAQAREAILIEDEVQHRFADFPGQIRCRSLVTKRWRLTLYQDVEWGELYDLEDDPNEVRNLWFDPKYHTTRSELMERLAREMIRVSECSPMPTQLA